MLLGNLVLNIWLRFQEFLVCATCCSRVQLYSRISHQKYLMYAECSKRVAEKRMQNPSKDTTVILNELLADEVWLSQVGVIRHVVT